MRNLFDHSAFFSYYILASSNNQCKTVGGPDSFQKCIFPFKWNGNTYYGCPIDPDDNSKTWCSTRVDQGGNHITGQNKYGFCNEACPKHTLTPKSEGITYQKLLKQTQIGKINLRCYFLIT